MLPAFVGGSVEDADGRDRNVGTEGELVDAGALPPVVYMRTYEISKYASSKLLPGPGTLSRYYKIQSASIVDDDQTKVVR